MSMAIVSVGVGGWYEQGVRRLERSLIHHGWGGEMIIWNGEYPPGSPTHQEAPYAFKLAAIQYARAAGHDQVLWLDASAWAVKNPLPILHQMETRGHYLWTSGYACAQWCNDRSLEYIGVTRKFAASIPMFYALVVGLDFRHERSRRFFDRWQKAREDGMFIGSWKREEGDMEEEPYTGHRHDQSLGSLIAFQEGMVIDGTMDLCRLYAPTMPESVLLTFQGI